MLLSLILAGNETVPWARRALTSLGALDALTRERCVASPTDGFCTATDRSSISGA